MIKKLSINDLIVVSVVDGVELGPAQPPEYLLSVVAEGEAHHSPHALLAGGLQGGLDELAGQALATVTAPGAEYEQVQQSLRLGRESVLNEEDQNILKFSGHFPGGRVSLLCQHTRYPASRVITFS